MSAEKLPEGWVQAVLGDYLFLKNGFAFKSTEYVSPEKHSFPVIRISDLNGTYASDSSAVHVLQEIDGFYIERGDLLIAMSGATTGKIGVYIGNTPAFQNQRVGNIKLHSSKYGNEKYRNYLISSKSKTILAEAYGGAQPNISGKSIESIKFYLAPLAEQKIIAEKLDTLLAQVDSTKARLEQIPQILKRFRQAVYQYACSGRILDKVNPKITQLETLVSIHNGARKPVSSVVREGIKGIYPYYGATGIVDYLNDFTHEGRFLLVGEDGANLLSKSKKLAYIINGKSWVNNHAHVLKEKDNNLLDFIQLAINSLDISQWVSGSAQPKLTKKSLLTLPIPVFTLEEQTIIVRRVEQLFAYADTIEKQVNNALARVNNLTQSILAKAFRGELTVQWRAENPDLISGENSAAALLEKIKAERAASGGKKASRKKS
ncbi:type I restriction endonuclease subunit S [Escherichia coli]|uniref:restriction endonuclease subunit S n=1 Tax=Escherichia coli TaxID=562 RepID=UPI0016500B90|nr:restriction endonuclease subunit S [Escherichia coli]EFJ1929073.1 type I restriction endonuclease subunit S [Escherichia coli]EHP1019515.1 restriction endonuclease subunit S [Escherichia coli]MBS9293159.1 restriction endonuclease subunit S [Escherichia coli]HBA7530681.1 type I restriction endonuclease subunit S [Escherichia coli]HBA7577770.1 type I restriction endonuclease subunit S [Escherichia coli]